MTFIVATNVVASRPHERRQTGTPTTRAKSNKSVCLVCQTGLSCWSIKLIGKTGPILFVQFASSNMLCEIAIVQFAFFNLICVNLFVQFALCNMFGSVGFVQLQTM